ncbi:beta-L-arabinofuranosidase domain-containing protein [uncultured Spirosoma sp.]|uniref:beta-L-arabinofuranosidase domain-containing protein n=1 Tax=uncultured Spirosoma sp. TaxID=278208 RepID=UPI0025911B55|nr:beta-L-arabinofuranosidase domain-containing protein [uncultured Spirosoma sp.]
MRTTSALFLALTALLTVGAVVGQPTSPVASRAPLAPARYLEVPLGRIRPEGWLRDQLAIMRDGTTGHLDEFYPKLKNDNGWLGGKGDNWEETPYWLDGALPLAYLLDDKVLIAKVKQYVDWSLDRQRASGYFGPLSKYERESGKPVVAGLQGEDWWPRMVMLKVLQQYYQATGDKRVVPFMTRYFRYQLANLTKAPLGQFSEWSTARGGDNLMTVYWLYNQTGDKFLLELARLINQQTTPWTQHFAGRNWVMEAAAQQNGEHWMDRHAVNVGMGLKLPVVQGQRDPKALVAFKTGWTDLMTLHGLPHGMFSGDEDLHGNEPTQGVELCAIVETMFSLEQAIAVTGDLLYMDALERITYNALPTQTTDDYNSRQYFQIANQVQVSRGTFDFSLPFGRGMNNVFGPYAGYTCCTANMHQGWTKFASHLWYAIGATKSQSSRGPSSRGPSSLGLAALEYAPNTITMPVAGGAVATIQEMTNYPFSDQIDFAISLTKPATFPFDLRIPGWCREATVLLNGQKLRSDKGGQVIRLLRTWKSGDRLTLKLPMTVTTTNWARNSRAIERGPLVYALNVKANVNKETEKTEGIYYEYKPASAWNYGLPQAVVKTPVQQTTVIEKAMPGRFIWNETNAPIEIRTTGRAIPSWQIVEGVARQPVSTREGIYQGDVSPKVDSLTLIPYGCTKLRVVAFPVVK